MGGPLWRCKGEGASLLGREGRFQRRDDFCRGIRKRRKKADSGKMKACVLTEVQNCMRSLSFPAAFHVASG